MVEFIFDDIGSYPLPEGVSREWIEASFEEEKDKVSEIIGSAFLQKLQAGVTVPTYPQFQDMNKQFLSILNDPECTVSPFSLKPECAKIVELEMLENFAKQYCEETGSKPNLRVCVTGPLELYLQQFGSASYPDILNLIASSINLFIKNAIEDAKNFNVHTISIDEPSLGINPEVSFDSAALIEAFELASSYAHKKGLDVEVHLHSPLYYEVACRTKGINVIGVESASNPGYLDLIDMAILDETKSYLRAGIARTDVFNLVGGLNEEYNTNAWKEPKLLEKLVTDLETPEVIEARLRDIYDRFGDRVLYVGPDCGLGSWPSQAIARKLLENVAIALERF
ncbi:methionine synthase [Methanohalophilus sp.]|uniref:methionine synthase n=1 Tax=Methanohalophilus sp. TaxID=1966352 RepID=UPI0026361641|nr:methionine synthase [Methanohalophilus sp.]MDK2892460.1 5-methyltetrahydropteroyltriglutamate--homocysteine methyltransferase [Methanohalophilus sp.]